MKRVILLSLLGLTVGSPALAQPPLPRGERDSVPRDQPVADIGGRWFNSGDARQPCEIRQRRLDGQALFVNEKGDGAWGSVEGSRVFIPDWSDGFSPGLSGRIRGDRIIWPDGNYWSRRPERRF